MGAYLIDNKPTISQYGPRTRKPNGLIVVHTAESVFDNIGPDTSAEAVANFIRTRTTYGSYHDLVDSDSIVNLVPYYLSAWQDGTGSNPYALSISFACSTHHWREMTPEKRRAFLRSGAKAFARQQAWLKANGYPPTPLRWITKAQSDAGVAGLIAHGHRDPSRRSDPGINAPNLFPFDEFLEMCRAELADTATPPQEEEFMAKPEDIAAVWDHDVVPDKGVQPAGLVLSQARTASQTAAANTATILSLLKTGLKVDVDEAAIVEGLRPYLIDAVTAAQAHPSLTAEQVVDELISRVKVA